MNRLQDDSTTVARRHFRALLEYYWLRPETALWRTLDCMALDDVSFRSPILEIGCGDGAFSFLHAGGRFDLSYDAFTHVGQLEAFFENVDIYDHFGSRDTAESLVTKNPDFMIDLGLDHKEALLRKAKLTGIYRELRLADANSVLPVENKRFRTIYSNILYWLEEYPRCLGEIARALTDDGITILQVPAETFREYSFFQRLYARTGDPNWAWLELVDRGRSESIKHCKSRDEWESDFAKAGLRPVHYRRYLSKTVLEAWDIGLRPISPFLIEMANMLPPQDRAQMKAKWVDGIAALVEPLCKLTWATDQHYPPGFHLFVLAKAA